VHLRELKTWASGSGELGNHSLIFLSKIINMPSHFPLFNKLTLIQNYLQEGWIKIIKQKEVFHSPFSRRQTYRHIANPYEKTNDVIAKLWLLVSTSHGVYLLFRPCPSRLEKVSYPAEYNMWEEFPIYIWKPTRLQVSTNTNVESSKLHDAMSKLYDYIVWECLLENVF